jgi:small subunit ribosomal protein S1
LKRQIKLSIKQLVPSSLGEYLAEHKEGDVVSGRVVEETAEAAMVELGEGIRAVCRVTASAAVEEKRAGGGVDLSALGSMLKDKWKGGAMSAAAGGVRKLEALGVGQIRSFRVVKLDRAAETIELELA